MCATYVVHVHLGKVVLSVRQGLRYSSLPSQEVIDLCLDMLRSADATASSKEEGSMLQDLEGQCRQMRPLVEAKIASLER